MQQHEILARWFRATLCGYLMAAAVLLPLAGCGSDRRVAGPDAVTVGPSPTLPPEVQRGLDEQRILQQAIAEVDPFVTQIEPGIYTIDRPAFLAHLGVRSATLAADVASGDAPNSIEGRIYRDVLNSVEAGNQSAPEMLRQLRRAGTALSGSVAWWGFSFTTTGTTAKKYAFTVDLGAIAFAALVSLLFPPAAPFAVIIAAAAMAGAAYVHYLVDMYGGVKTTCTWSGRVTFSRP